MLTSVDVAILGGGCAGLATALAISEVVPGRQVRVIDGRRAADPRTWCFWDNGENPAPEAVACSWDRWEIRGPAGVVTASDPDHPYRMVRAADYRRAMAIRLGRSGLVDLMGGVTVTGVDALPDGAIVSTSCGPVAARTLLDARGPISLGDAPPGRVLLHQRFLGQWVHTIRPVFDTTTVTLMDFAPLSDGSGDREVQFMYVLPIGANDALIESTVFSRSETRSENFRGRIAEYISQRWHLNMTEWTVTGQEAGDIPMTDMSVEPGRIAAIGVRGGATRSSTGYAFGRIQRHAVAVAQALHDHAPIPPVASRPRTRLLDAVFLRFIRDQPHHAPDAFARMFGRLPGPVTVRFLTESSSIIDELRLVAVLPKRRFLRAALTTLRERVLRRKR